MELNVLLKLNVILTQPKLDVIQVELMDFVFSLNQQLLEQLLELEHAS
jgi:hypothetical protein